MPRHKGEREKYYVERMENLFQRIKDAGFTREEICEITDYLREKQNVEYGYAYVRALASIGRKPYPTWECPICHFQPSSEEEKERHERSHFAKVEAAK